MGHVRLLLATTLAACTLAGCLDTSDGAVDGDVTCLTLTPPTLDFGEVPIDTVATATVTLVNCGNAAADIAEMQLRGDPSFSMTPAAAALLAPGDAADITLAFAPVAEGQATGFLDVRATTGDAVSAALRGTGAAPPPCETTILATPDDDEVQRGTTLRLSFTTTCASYETSSWEIAQPAGSHAIFSPSPASPAPTVELNVVGTYVIRLTTTHPDGVEATAEWTVQVRPRALYVIELTWETPGDPDPSDEGQQAGADLDLHLTHPLARQGHCPGGWFDEQWDAFALNPDPEWGSLDPAIDDNPLLDRDDTDGGGPETIVFQLPEDGARYPIGVHVRNSHDYGPSYATVRVYVAGELRFERTEGPLAHTDLWFVGTLDHGTRHVIPDGTLCEGYVDPRFPRQR